jgi:hypothetical protein
MKKIKCIQFSEEVEYMEDNFNEIMIVSVLVIVMSVLVIVVSVLVIVVLVLVIVMTYEFKLSYFPHM